MSTQNNPTPFPGAEELKDTQLAFDDPTTRHPTVSPPEQDQPEPGLDVKTDPVPDIGLDSYRGLGRLQGRRALVTGGDSGIGAAVALEELTNEQVDEAFQVNIKSMFTLSRATLQHMGPGSTIINTTSVEAYSPQPLLMDYASTKAAINNFTKSLAQSVAPRGIRVNAVAPGPVWTVLQVSDGQPTEALPEFGHQTPLGRAGQPVEMAPVYVFLASPESSYVVGDTLNANGGMPTP